METLWCKRDKTLCDIEFLKICYKSNTTPKFLRKKVYKYHLQSTSHVRNLKQTILETELRSKGKNLKKLQKKLTNALTTLQSYFSALKS